MRSLVIILGGLFLYSVTEELPIFLVIFLIPAGVASFVAWKFS